MVRHSEGWTVVGLMDALFGPQKLAPLASDIREARKRAEFLREVPDAEPVRHQLARLTREIVRDADSRYLREEGDYASGLARVARHVVWDEPDIDRLAVGFSLLDRMVQVRMDQLTRLTLAGRD